MNKFVGDMRKIKLSIGEQVLYMKDRKGIKFSIIDEDAAKRFLLNNNYYFKIKSYAKNYDKYSSGKRAGKYINLEFAYLQELSTIDMHLRKFIIKMTLDIEHYLKTQLLRDFSNNPKEDGYDIINDFLDNNPYIKDNISQKAHQTICSDLIEKYSGNFAIWNIVEILSFGDFIKLYKLYYEKYKTQGGMHNHLWSVKFLRNVAAHNNCLLNSLKQPYSMKIKPNKEINTHISRIPSISLNTRRKKMANPIVHDFVVSLYVFNEVVTSKKTKEYTLTELKELIDERMVRNKDYFKNNEIISSYYNFIKKIVDYFHDKCV